MSLLKRALARPTGSIEHRGADPRAQWGDSTPPTNGMLGGSVAGVYVNEKSALQLASTFACVSIITDSVVTLPIRQYKRGDVRSEVDVSAVVADPYSELMPHDFYSQVMVSLLLRGNFYALVLGRDPRGFPTQLQPFHPDQVTVRRNSITGAIEYRFCGQVQDIDDVFHVRGMSVPGGLVGLSVIEYQRNLFGLGRAAELYAQAFFANSATPAGVIKVPGDLTPEDAKDLMGQWLMGHQGVGQAQLPGLLTGGAEFQSISLAPEDAQFIQSRSLTTTDVCMTFRVPPHMVGQTDKTTSWGTGIEQQEIGFTRNTLLSWTSRLEASLNRIIPPDQIIRFDYSHRLRGDTLQRFQAYTLARQGGWLNVDDIRTREDMEPLPDGLGTDYLQPLNFAPIGSPAAQGAVNPVAGPPPVDSEDS